MLHHAHFDIKSGEPPFAAIANLMGAHSKSGPPTGGQNAPHFCAAAVRFEPFSTLVPNQSLMSCRWRRDSLRVNISLCRQSVYKKKPPKIEERPGAAKSAILDPAPQNETDWTL